MRPAAKLQFGNLFVDGPLAPHVLSKHAGFGIVMLPAFPRTALPVVVTEIVDAFDANSSK